MHPIILNYFWSHHERQLALARRHQAAARVLLFLLHAVGDEVHLVIKGVTNSREYNSAGEILSITGNYAKVRFRQPWARPHNCMRETMVDLRTCKKIKRRIRHNAPAQRPPATDV